MTEVPRTAKGVATLATPEEIAKEESRYFLASDTGFILVTDNEEIPLVPNIGDLGYTHPNLHRRIDDDPVVPPGSNYPFVDYDPQGNPYKQSVVIGVWDGRHSYRTTTTYTHDEESTTCEIP